MLSANKCRLNNLQEFGRIIMKERMLLDDVETPEEFCQRISRGMVKLDDEEKKIAHATALLSSVSIIPSSALCQHLNLQRNDTTPSACHLTVFSHSYEAFSKLNELDRIAKMAIMGTGVGVGGDYLRYKGSNVAGELKNSFVEICQYLNAATTLNVSARKSRVAVFLSLHHICSMICLTLRQQNARVTSNIFYGVMIPNFFMEMQRKDKNAMWYFFDGNTTLEGLSLNDCYGEEYESLYWRMVEKKLYVKKMYATQVLGELISCLTENGFPYVVWRDHVNMFNNHRDLGTIQTLNLCTEICQHAGSDSSSMCTLMTVNIAAYCEDYPLCKMYEEIVEELAEYGLHQCCPQFDETNEARLLMHCFTASYTSTFLLNRLLGDKTSRRELGVTPTGLFDAVYILCGRDAAYNDAMIHYSALVAEYMYIGCVLSSIVYNRKFNVICVNFSKSEFAKGLFQFDLRNVTPSLSLLWNRIRPFMKKGMANSMLTAQAPTATTSLLTNVTESVQFPMSGAVQTTKNSGTGRFANIPFFLYKSNETDIGFNRPVTIAKQVQVFAKMAPYVDQSQSVIINCSSTYEDVFRILRYTYDNKLKTALYYTVFNSNTPYIDLSGCDACTQ
ncbi:ORF37 [Agrotis segetum granulovirus]|uniref:ORF37 n=1 Tax=Agrotis segetum granulosis virus TaxID=10464 RepID=Q6QXF6_GVAS|nr:RNR_I [Agrotis segetum granulovirus]AAS82701.1 ORF37 [Agrotis segetum granulovirus]AHN92081.1 rr1 [Agrotis segetum granulovirus]AKN63316.1 RNR_I [Agrotis segetum granulovirus]